MNFNTSGTTGSYYDYVHNTTFLSTTHGNRILADFTYEDYYNDLYIEMENGEKNSLYIAAVIIIKVVFPAFVALGTIANTLVVVVLRRGAINTDNLSLFLSVLAVVDTVFLYTSAFKTWVRVMWGLELLHVSSWSCKLGLFLNQVSSTLSAWLVLVIAWQRWYTCSRPFDRCCPVDNSKCGYASLACLLLILVGANSYVLITAELYKDPVVTICAPTEKYDSIITHVFPFVLTILYSGLPALLLIVLNSLLARVLYTSRRSLLSNSDTARTSCRDDSQVRARYNQVTALLMTLSVSWFLLTTPHTLLKMIEHIPDTFHDRTTQNFLNVIFFVFLYINHSINFFLYCALIRGFRREVKKLASKTVACAVSLSHCCYSHLLRYGGRHLAARNSSIMNVNNYNYHCNTDSFVPLIELHSGIHSQDENQNGCRHDHIMTCA